ncbi:docking protein 1 isoform X2 [Electrophorus electricus]|uniref:docking protein 1 isoform X2 n=1 Tax=Electrophorus electricus TaxID=8005 RepID=UPI000F09FF04|nr:docking protein 1 isoform X2 [Electrophorus electricus]
MEEDIQKRGLLYLQQQRFGKWRKVWCILYQESICSISRLEFFESKDGNFGTLEKSKCKQENKKVIKLSDCIRVSDADVDGCPKDCKAFLVETTEKIFVFAVDMSELEDWMQKLCELAFPMNWAERGATRQTNMLKSDEATMSNNSLYCGKEAAMKDFKVTIRRTDATDRCGLRGHYLLRTDFDSLLLKEPKSGDVLFTWPYRYLRRFGRDKMTFSFEAGRRCDSGEGNFEFDTKQGNAIFQYVEAAINLQKAGISQRQASSGASEQEPVSQPPKVSPSIENSTIYSMLTEGAMKDRYNQTSPHRSRLETPADKHLTGVKSLNLDTRPPPRKNQVKNFRSCPLAKTDEVYSRASAPAVDREIPAEQEEQSRALCPSSKSDDAEYSLPFDNIAKNIMVDILAASHQHSPPVVEPCSSIETKANEESTEPLYDSIDESAIRSSFSHEHKTHLGSYTTLEHIYDEPEGCALTPSGPTSLYDDPEEVRGDAWKTLGAVMDPSGHEYPYNALSDDYAVPKPARRALKAQQERGYEDDSSTYDNVILKMKASNKTE